MTGHASSRREHLLLYEPRTEGHHLGWLRFITEDLLSAGFRLSLAVDGREAGRARVTDHLAELLKEVNVLSAYDASGRRHGDRKSGSVAFCLRESGAEHVFLCALDEVASSCWRRAALGWFPPETLRGHLGGIYHRPRFLVAPRWSVNRWFKEAGFRRLLRAGWLRQVLLVDEYQVRELEARWPGAPIYFLPDPCPNGYDAAAAEARRQLGVPLERRIFLCYGTGHRRKGLHLAVAALRGLPLESRCFLLCVGQQDPTGATARGLETLVREGRAHVINRYVSPAEERLSFAACDVVLLPYVHHFGSSGVLSRAMAAGKMVIVSDEQLLGRLTREHGLGLLFRPTDVSELRERVRQAAQMSAEELVRWGAAARRYAARYSRAAYRAALLASVGAGPSVPTHG